MRKKGAIEISLGTIVITIIALVFLGLAIAFITGMFRQLGQVLVIGPPDIPATPDQPLVLPGDTLNMRPGQQLEVSLNFYNIGDTELTPADLPQISCSQSIEGYTPELEIAAAGQTVPIEARALYKFIVKAVDAKRALYPCTLAIGEVSKQFFLKIE